MANGTKQYVRLPRFIRRSAHPKLPTIPEESEYVSQSDSDSNYDSGCDGDSENECGSDCDQECQFVYKQN